MDSEQRVLGIALVYHLFADLSPEDFLDELHRKVWARLQAGERQIDTLCDGKEDVHDYLTWVAKWQGIVPENLPLYEQALKHRTRLGKLDKRLGRLAGETRRIR